MLASLGLYDTVVVAVGVEPVVVGAVVVVVGAVEVVVGAVVVVVGVVEVVVGAVVVVVGVVEVVVGVVVPELSVCTIFCENTDGEVVCVIRLIPAGERRSVRATVTLASPLEEAKGTFLTNVQFHDPFEPE